MDATLASGRLQGSRPQSDLISLGGGLMRLGVSVSRGADTLMGIPATFFGVSSSSDWDKNSSIEGFDMIS